MSGDHDVPRPGNDMEARWQNRFREYADRFDDDAGIAGWTEGGLQARFRSFVARWRATGESRRRGAGRWLDAGCGAGTYSRFLVGEGMEVIGLDYSLETVKKAEARSGTGISWMIGDVRRLPVRASLLDGIICFGVAQTLSRPEDLVRQLGICVRPGGEVWLDALNVWCLPNLLDTLRRRIRRRPLHLRYDSPAKLKALFREHGFTQVRLYWVPVVPQRFRRLSDLAGSASFQRALQWMPPLGALLCHSILVTAVRADGSL